MRLKNIILYIDILITETKVLTKNVIFRYELRKFTLWAQTFLQFDGQYFRVSI